MTDVNFRALSQEQLIAMADGLLAANQPGLARGLYRLAITSGPLRASLLAREGLAATPSAETPAMLRVLAELDKLGFHAFVSNGLATWRKTLPFFEDRRFVELATKHAGLLPIANWHWNLQTVVWAVRQVEALEGDFVELGVFKGHTTLFAAEYVGFRDWPRKWTLYDTFDGIPDDQLDPGWAESNRDAYKGTFSFEEVSARFAHIPNIRVVKGRVPEILDEDPPGPIAFLHMDLNNATAEIQALDRLYERIVPGGIVVFDDFGWASARAQFDAEIAWAERRGVRILPLPTGQGLLVKS